VSGASQQRGAAHATAARGARAAVQGTAKYGKRRRITACICNASKTNLFLPHGKDGVFYCVIRRITACICNAQKPISFTTRTSTQSVVSVKPRFTSATGLCWVKSPCHWHVKFQQGPKHLLVSLAVSCGGFCGCLFDYSDPQSLPLTGAATGREGACTC